MKLLMDRLLESVARAPAEPAFIAEGRVITYRAMLALVSAALRFLREKGIRPGDAVAVRMGQSPLHVIALIALARLGALTVPLFPNIREDERAALLRRFGVRWVLVDRPEAGGHGIPVILMQGLHARGDESDLDAGGFSPSPDTPLRAVLTSGTTDAQRGFILTHEAFMRRLERRYYNDVERPRVMPPSLAVIGATHLSLWALCLGGTIVFPASYEPAAYLAAIHLHAVTHVTLPPANLASLLEHLPEDKPAFPSIAQLRVLGATPTPELVRRTRAKFSPNIYATYSMTEVGVIAVATPEILATVPGSAGRVAEGAQVDIDERGEIRVKVEGMPAGYHGEESTAFRDGWFHTGDLGRLTPDGLLYVEGRADDVINVGGRKVAPAYVESVLELHPKVREAAVFAIEDSAAGARLVAVVVPMAGIDWRDLERYSRASFEAYAPVRYYEAASLPRNVMGKLRRDALAAFAASNAKPVSAGEVQA
jgi:acyl-coenzyme A synthetase/AMP-(fatty) acid ligase